MAKNNTVTFNITVTKGLREGLRNEVLKSLQVHVTKPGFRKGHVPLNVVEKEYDPMFISYEVEKRSLEKALDKYLKESGLRFYPDSIQVTDRKEKGDDLIFECNVEVEPEINIPDIKKVSKPHKYEVKTDKKEFEDYKDSVRKSYATWEDPKDLFKVENTSYVRLKITCSVKKEESKIYPKSWFSKEELDVFPGLSKKLNDLLKDKKIKFTSKVSKEFEIEEMKGKEVDFEVEFLDHKLQILPEFDETLAKNLGFKSIKECEDLFNKAMETNKLNKMKQEKEEEFLEKLLKDAKFEVPSVVVQRALRGRKEEVSTYLKSRGVSFSDYLNSNKMTEEEFEKKESEVMLPILKKQMLLDRLVDKYGTLISHDEIHKYIDFVKANNPNVKDVSHMQAEFVLKRNKFFDEYVHGEEKSEG